MTISYPDSFGRSLLLWKGSLWKAVLKDLIVWYFLYYVVMVAQYFFMNDKENAQTMHIIIDYFETGTSYIPLTFLLGFFVAAVLARWWEQFNWISWPDSLCYVVNQALPGPDNRNLRRLVVRWANLQASMAWRLISVRTKARFPTENHLVTAGLMTEKEKQLYDKVDAPYGKWFLPIVWMSNLFTRLRRENVIKTDVQLSKVHKEIMNYRAGFAMLMVYDWIVIPLVYVQVVAVATYGFFGLCLVARQPKFYPEGMEKNDVTVLFPFFTTLQMLFYLGWLKVAQFLMHPFGDDDDDFELNWILDRNTQLSFMMVDELAEQLPELEDPFHGQKVRLPHTKASVKIRDVEPADNLKDVKFKPKHMDVISPDEATELWRAEDDHDAVNRFRSMVRQASLRKSSTRNQHPIPQQPETEQTHLPEPPKPTPVQMKKQRDSDDEQVRKSSSDDQDDQ